MATKPAARKRTTKPTKTVRQPLPLTLKWLLIGVGGFLFVMLVVTISLSVSAGFYLNQKLNNGTVQVDQNGSVEVKSQDGSTNFSSKNILPANWPTDIPVYSGTTIVYSYASQGAEPTVNVTLKSSDTAEQIAAWYQDQLTVQKWQPTDAQGFFPIGTIGIAKKDIRRLSIVISQEKDKAAVVTSINISQVLASPSPAKSGE